MENTFEDLMAAGQSVFAEYEQEQEQEAAPVAPEPEVVAALPNPLEAEIQQMRQQLQAIQQRASEADQNARYWAGIAQENAARTPEPVPTAARAFDVEEFAIDLARRGPEALANHYVTPAQVADMIMQQARVIAKEEAQAAKKQTMDELAFDSTLHRDFPDLRPGTPFWDEAGAEAQALGKFSPELAGTDALMVAGAKIVKARNEAIAAANARHAGGATEQQRQARVAAQTGPSGKAAGVPATAGGPVKPIRAITRAFFDEVTGGSKDEDIWAAQQGRYGGKQSRGGK